MLCEQRPYLLSQYCGVEHDTDTYVCVCVCVCVCVWQWRRQHFVTGGSEVWVDSVSEVTTLRRYTLPGASDQLVCCCVVA